MNQAIPCRKLRLVKTLLVSDISHDSYLIFDYIKDPDDASYTLYSKKIGQTSFGLFFRPHSPADWRTLSLPALWHSQLLPSATDRNAEPSFQGKSSPEHHHRSALPRGIAALLVGASLAASGAIMQGITRNAIADPGLLGINSGAGLALICGYAFSKSIHYSSILLLSLCRSLSSQYSGF